MAAGRYDRRITIETPTPGRDSFGQPVLSWAEHAKMWAEWEPASGGEGFSSDQRTATQRGLFRCRYVAGITPKMRVNFDGELYQIEDVAEPQRRRELELTVYAFEVRSGA